MDWSCTLSGYVAGAVGSPVTPTSTGNEAIYINLTSSTDFTINVSAGASLPSIRKGAGYTGDVSVVASVTVTLTQLKDNTEVRVMAAGTDTELFGIEAATVGTTDDRSFSFTSSVGVSVDIFLVSILYENIEIYAYSIPASNADLPQAQRLDKNYYNP